MVSPTRFCATCRRPAGSSLAPESLHGPDFGNGPLHHLKKQGRVRQIQVERHDVVVQLARQLHQGCRKNNRAAHLAETGGQFAHFAEDFRVLEITHEILQQKNAVAANRGDCRESLHGVVAFVNPLLGSAPRQPRGDGPDVERDIEGGGNLGEQLFHAGFFTGFHGENRVAGVNQQAELVALVGRGSHRSSVRN